MPPLWLEAQPGRCMSTIADMDALSLHGGHASHIMFSPPSCVADMDGYKVVSRTNMDVRPLIICCGRSECHDTLP